MQTPTTYLLGAELAEEERLKRQIDEMAGISELHLDKVAIEKGQHVVDFGCGPGGALAVLACRVGEAGSVLGIERNPRLVEAARRFLRQRNLPNVEILAADAYDTGLPRQSFDGAHMRLVIVNVPEPDQIVGEMVSLVRPGGWIACMEPDFAAPIIDPPCLASERLLAAFKALSAAQGGDLFIGRRLHRLFRAARASNIQVGTIMQPSPPGHARRGNFMMLVKATSEDMIRSGLIDRRTLEGDLADLNEYLSKPDVQVTSPLYYHLSARAV
jgi:ubiquinone/menaquinone biosynthesis C-methylase UbiE